MLQKAFWYSNDERDLSQLTWSDITPKGSLLMELCSMPIRYGVSDAVQHIPVAITSLGNSACVVYGGRSSNTSPMNLVGHIEGPIQEALKVRKNGEKQPFGAIGLYLQQWPEKRLFAVRSA